MVASQKAGCGNDCVLNPSNRLCKIIIARCFSKVNLLLRFCFYGYVVVIKRRIAFIEKWYDEFLTTVNFHDIMCPLKTFCQNHASGGYHGIHASENPTNCYSHSTAETCTCPRRAKRSVADVIADTIACYRNGADRVNPEIKVIAWSWAWNEYSKEIIQKLPSGVILQAQSELDVPVEKGGIKGVVKDYSMSNIGPGERALEEWALAKERGLEISAKVQVNTSWEASTCPALPVYPLIEEHVTNESAFVMCPFFCR